MVKKVPNKQRQRIAKSEASYNFKKIEKKWKKRWNDANVFKAKANSRKPKYYVLEMYPYPSGVAAHVGHSRNYVMGDCLARYKRMQGYNVLYPMGWDSFGLPSENAAIAKGIHPTKSIAQNIKVMKNQFDALSLSYDWDREVTTHDPEYYKWNQWLFLQLYKKGLAYQKKAAGNWCSKCKTTIANEDVKQGNCWRCGTEIIQKDIPQWFIKVTAYVNELLKGLDKLKWSDRLKTLQRNWIGKSHGIDLIFKVKGLNKEIRTYTTRPDTYYGITFMVLAPEHKLVPELIKGTAYEHEAKRFIEATRKMSEVERTFLLKEKKGCPTGQCVINSLTKEEIPILLANYVVGSYGTGAVIGVPTQDQRDFEFAEKYGLRFKNVINPKGEELKEFDMRRAYTDDGILTKSGSFTGMNNREAIPKMIDFLAKKGLGKKTINYKIRDWCVSRQRYWGTPIPIVYCDRCGTVPLSKKDLPLKLPLNVDFKSKNVSPLGTNSRFVNTTCPKCKGKARRETDTMTTFVDSSWYFLRFANPNYSKGMFDKKAVAYWMPVDQYIGGAEHAVGHLIYSRFITKFLQKLGHLNFKEPFLRLLNQGMVQKNGAKMSKSKGNTIDPRSIIEKYGADTLRTYLLVMAAPDKDVEWSDRDLQSTFRFLQKVVSLASMPDSKKRSYIMSVAHRKIKAVTDNLENLEYHKAIIELMDLAGKLIKYPSKEGTKILLRLLAPFAPHICEDTWEKLGNRTMLASSSWPKFDKQRLDLKAEKAEEIIQTVARDIHHIIRITNKQPKNIFVYVIPPELKMYSGAEESLAKEFRASVRIVASNKADYDPEKKAKKAKPGKPEIYLE